MFRENVLIALTILITILALSFVILLTVYMQIHAMDARIKRLEQDDNNGVAIPEKTILLMNATPAIPTEKEAEQSWVRIITVTGQENSGSAPNGINKDSNSDEAKSKRQVTKQNATTTTTENPNPEGFYTDDDYFLQFAKPPANSRHIPYNLYHRNGHITLELPPNIDLSQDMDHIKKVLEEINELHHVQKQRDEQQRQIPMNGYNTWYPPTKERQQGLIWIRNKNNRRGSVPRARPTLSPARAPAPPKRKDKEPFDDSKIFDIVNQNHMRDIGMDWILGKRRKRSARKG